jgi:hypothetical protein
VAVFKNLKFKFLRAFDRTRGGQRSEKNRSLWASLFSFAPDPVAMPWTLPLSSPAPSAPTRAVRNGGEEEERAQDPLSSPSAPCTSPTAVTSPEPTHNTPSPRPNPSSTRARPPCPVLLVARRQGPRTSELLDALALDSLAYKNPLRSNERTHPTHSSLPDTFSSSRSLSFDAALDAGEATRRRRRCRVRPLLSKPTPGTGGGVLPDSFPTVAVEPCFLYARRRRRHLSLCAQVSSTLTVEHEADAPLD